MSNTSNVLKSIYYDIKHPASFGSVRSLYKYAKIRIQNLTLKEVKDWLSEQLSYTLHKPARKTFLRNRIIVSRINEQFQADLVDMQEFSEINNGFKYLLTVIDCFSKYLWSIPLKSKHSNSIINAFKIVFNERKPEKLQTDKGREFDNQNFRQFLNTQNIKYFTSQDKKIKCAIVERVNRTIKDKMFKYFTAKGTRNYVNILKNLVDSYNNRWHRSIKMKPIEVNHSNEKEVFRNLYGTNNLINLIGQRDKGSLDLGNTVRKKYDLTHFDRGYYPNWSDETYTVDRKLPKIGKRQYVVKDYYGNTQNRRFYKEELQKISPNTPYRIDRILRTRRRNNRLEYLVSWIGYRERTWIPAQELMELRHEL
jgi:hypothetical protein